MQSDVYACGIVLHELLVGENEFRSRDPSETLRRVLLHDLTDVTDRRPDVPGEVDQVIRRATMRSPDVRTASADELARALRGLLSTPENELGARLRDAVSADFTGPLPETLGLPTLDELDDAWRNPPRDEDRVITQEVELPDFAPAESRSGISPTVAIAIGVLAIVAIGGLAPRRVRARALERRDRRPGRGRRTRVRGATKQRRALRDGE